MAALISIYENVYKVVGMTAQLDLNSDPHVTANRPKTLYYRQFIGPPSQP